MPPYEILIHSSGLCGRRRSLEEIVEGGYDASPCARDAMVDGSEYKRRQARSASRSPSGLGEGSADAITTATAI